MSIRTISTEQLRRMGDQEGLILQGCGGDSQEWVDGINEILTQEGILKKGAKFEERYLSLLLVLMLLIGIVPTVHADGIDTGDVVENSEQTEALEDNSFALSPAPMALSTAGDYAVMSIASTQNSIMLFDYADNGNYTTVLNSQVACAYKPNGTGSTKTAYIKNLGWHFARYGGVAYPDDPLYCIEPWRSYGASTSGNSVDRGVTLDGSGSTTGSNVWYALPAARREAIGLILLYSNQMWDKSVSVATTKKDSNPNVPLRIATQFLIYEIVCGLRNPTTFQSNSTNECGTSGDIFYNAGEASVPYFAPKYNALVDTIQAAKKIPSFTASTIGSVPTITLNGEETSVTDSNGVLSNFSFTDGSGAEFYKSGNTLYITQTGDISESTVFKATRNLPSAASSTFNIARILADTRYLGDSGFPVLIDAAVFLDAEEKRKKKAPSVQKTDAQTVLRRKCGCRITPHIEHEVLYLLNCLARNPERIVTPQTPREHSQRLDALKAELEELISQLPVDENRAREVLQEIAAEMYADIDPREYETQRMRRAFQKEELCSELDANLIAMNISAVLVDSNGKVKIRLKNDQIVERGE